MTKRVNPPLPTRTRKLAARLRSSQTDAEHNLWQILRADRLNGLKFRRQHPIPPYIVDFVSLRLKLVIELDGSQHTVESDTARTRFLEAHGFHVLRFWDNDVLLNLDAVAEAIFNAAQDRTLSPTPLPEGEG